MAEQQLREIDGSIFKHVQFPLPVDVLYILLHPPRANTTHQRSTYLCSFIFVNI